MNKRFMLSTAGLSAAAIGGSANAALLTFNYDYYAGEAGWSVTDSGGNVVISATGATNISTSLSYSAALYYASGSSPYPAGYLYLVDVDLAAGDYSINLTDTWGDGWSYFSPVGGGMSAFVYGSYALSFMSGSSNAGAFTVAAVPAPGALALLGLAGLAAGRRRRD